MAQMSRPVFESHYPVDLQLYEHPSMSSVVLVVDGRSHVLVNDLARQLSRCLAFFPGTSDVTVDHGAGTATVSLSPSARDRAMPVRVRIQDRWFALQRDTAAALGVALMSTVDDMDIRAVMES